MAHAAYHWLPLGPRGSPPDTLLLHGFTGLGADWSGWPHRRAALAVDLPGHGGSADPSGGFEAEIARLLAALPASIERLIGYSLGGRIALGLLAAAPTRFREITVISAHPGLMDPASRAARRQADQVWIDLLTTVGITAFVDAWEAQPLFATESAAPAPVRAARRAGRLSQRPAGLARSLTAFGLAAMPDLRAAICAWPGRLVWVCGARDGRFAAIAGEIAGLRPQTRVYLLPGAGHNPLCEVPGQLWPLLGPGAADQESRRWPRLGPGADGQESRDVK